jgi:hypothetical protein
MELDAAMVATEIPTMCTSLLGEYLQDALRWTSDKAQILTQPSNMSENLLHDAHHLVLAVTNAFENRGKCLIQRIGL